MRILIISDIHANLTALDAVLADVGEFDEVWCLGDLVGYGPDPNECVARVRELPRLQCIIGNHDAAALRRLDPETFNPEARLALQWTQKTLNDATVSYLKSLPEIIHIDSVTITHGSPRHPVWEYLLDTRTATINFDHFDTPYCFVGHTHLPVIYYLGRGHKIARLIVPEPQSEIQLSPRAILNPGSVGQPRDRDIRASYAIFDNAELSWEIKRVPYDIASVQERMLAAQLPDRHIQRLASGW
jgi:predicted phosphodiesterase